ncbi:MAG: PD-(D/E)XK nuclease family protein [Candidatus Paceibacterota bacterium]
MKQNLFEILGIASIERIHSQMMCWLFSDSPLTPIEKSQLLQIINPKAKIYSTFQCLSEYKNIDIIIRADSDVYVIENKIKSSEHDNQLSKYLATIQSDSSSFFQNTNRYFAYLTLVQEKTKAVNESWVNITYQQIFSNLKNYKRKKPSSFDEFVLNEYIHTVERLVVCVEDFISNHSQYANVFEDGWKTKAQKLENLERCSDKQKYIAQNQLETILQRSFLGVIADSMVLDKDKPEIDETHGTALLQIMYSFHELTKLNKYNIGIQYQGDSIKLNIASKNYKNSTIKDISKRLTECVQIIARQNKYRINKGKTREYISISKQLDKEIWEMNLDEIIAVYQREYEHFKKLAKEIIRNGIFPK